MMCAFVGAVTVEEESKCSTKRSFAVERTRDDLPFDWPPAVPQSGRIVVRDIYVINVGVKRHGPFSNVYQLPTICMLVGVGVYCAPGCVIRRQHLTVQLRPAVAYIDLDQRSAGESLILTPVCSPNI
jgi:hypothetical protein